MTAADSRMAPAEAPRASRLSPVMRKVLRSQQFGLVGVIVVLLVALSVLAGSHVDDAGHTINNFLNSHTLIQTATDASFVAIMAVGATIVIISGGIDLSVGSVYALPGLAFVASKAESILLPEALTRFAKSPLGLGAALYPVPMLWMLVVSVLGAVYLQKTVMGRHVFALGGNAEASRFSGLRLGRIQIGVYVLAGLTAGLAAFLGSGFYGSVSCGDATGYELYVIASAVVGGARLSGGRGSAINAMLGAVLIVLIRQSIRTLHLDQNYEWIIIGCAIVIAVVLDQASARFAARRLAQGEE
jgi:ribose transport system permease protein